MRRRRKSAKTENEDVSGGFLRKYRFELIWLLVVALGVFLVVERMNIRSNLISGVRLGLAGIGRWIGGAAGWLSHFVSGITLSDALGYVLILVALLAILYRTRWRLQRMPSYTDVLCPDCNGEIHRVHRRFRDTAVSWFLPVRRYRCSDRDCRWQGVRVIPANRLDRPSR